MEELGTVPVEFSSGQLGIEAEPAKDMTGNDNVLLFLAGDKRNATKVRVPVTTFIL